MISGAEPNLRFHKPSVIMTVGFAPRRSSSGLKVRPISGLTPRISKNPAEIISPCKRSGSPAPERLKPVDRYAARGDKVRFICRQSTILGYDIEQVLQFAI